MAYSVFSKEANDALKEPMFLGNPVNVARYDQQKHPIFEKLTEKQLSFFWRPEEVDLSKDNIQFNNDLPPHQQHIFTSNLKYQTLLDSVQGRSPNVTRTFCAISFRTHRKCWIRLFRTLKSKSAQSRSRCITTS
jgi:ribonucleoside-diphosphate reductase beta chain